MQCSIRALRPRVFAFVALVALAGCATAPPPAPSPADRWRTDLDAYRDRSRKVAADLGQVRDDFKALVAEESFPGLEDKIATLAARLARGEERDEDGALARSLWGLTLGELFLFQRYLALSTRVVELEAAHAELESARLDLVLKRLQFAPDAGADAASGAALVAEPAPSLFACPRHRVGRIEFVSCR